MNYNVKILLTPAFLLASFYSHAQQFRDDYSKLQDAYTKLDNFSCELQVRMFENSTDKKPSEVINSSLRKKGEAFHYTMGKTTMILNEKCILFVDQRQKQMTYTIRRDSNKKAPSKQDPVSFAIDSLIKKSDSIVYAGMLNGIKHYTAFSAKGMIQKTDLFITENNLLQKVIYSYDKKKYSSEKVEIEYMSMQLKPVFEENEFSEKKYAVYRSGLLKPLGSYAGYVTNIIDPNDFK